MHARTPRSVCIELSSQPKERATECQQFVRCRCAQVLYKALRVTTSLRDCVERARSFIRSRKEDCGRIRTSAALPGGEALRASACVPRDSGAVQYGAASWKRALKIWVMSRPHHHHNNLRVSRGHMLDLAVVARLIAKSIEK